MQPFNYFRRRVFFIILFLTLLVSTLSVGATSLELNNQEDTNSGQTALTTLPYPPPASADLPPDVEKTRAQTAIEHALTKYLEFNSFQYQINLEEIVVEKDWAYAMVQFEKEDQFGDEPIYILAHRNSNGIWQALLPNSNEVYFQWLNNVPDNLLSADEKARLNTMASETQLSPHGIISLDFRGYIDDVELRTVIYETIRNKPFNLLNGQQFVITSAHWRDNWAIISVASLDGSDSSLEHVGGGTSSSLILAMQDSASNWRAGLAGTLLFTELLNIVPPEVIGPEAKEYLDPLNWDQDSVNSTNSVEYKFPWPEGDWDYRAGWHLTPWALDIGTWGSDKRILASAGGVIGPICRGNLSANVKITDADGVTIEYFHIDVNQLESNIFEGAIVTRGQVLGTLRSGTWSFDGDGCGYTVGQNEQSAHIHWAIPTTGPFTVDGWTITYPNDIWSQGGNTISPGQTLHSTNIPHYGNPTAQVKLYDQANYQGSIVYSGGTGFSNNPSANSYSLEIPSGWSVKTWRGDNRTGEERCWSSSVSNLQDHGWQLAIQSIEAFNSNVCTPPPTGEVKLFDQANYQGSIVFSGGTGFSNTPSANSYSLEIPSGWSVKTWRGDNRTGEERCWSASVSNLQDHGWQLAIQSIEAFSSNVCPPVAGFDAWPLSGNAPLVVSMHNISSGIYSTCSWNYGDGTMGTSCADYHDHTYVNPGTYAVQLTVTGTNGSNTQTRTDYISVAAVPPIANFDAWPLSGNAPLTVSIHNISDGDYTSCLWEYGDGLTGTSCADYHDHTYTSPGTYSVELTVTGPGGSDTHQIVGYISVINQGEPDLRPHTLPGYESPIVPSSVPGTNQVGTLFAGQTTYFDWHFINGGTTTASGDFYVDLHVDDTQYIHYPFSNYGAGQTSGFDDWSDTVTDPGWHTVTLSVDPENTISESDEANNIWQQSFYWTADLYEPNNDVNGATNIAYGDTLSAEIGPAADHDFYQFSGSANDKIIIDIDAQSLFSDLDSVIELIDSDGSSILAFNDDELTFYYDSKLGYTLPHDGTYYIRVRDYGYNGDEEYFYNIRLYTDHIVPTASIISPLDSAQLDPNSVTVTVEGSDGESGIRYVDFYWHDDNWGESDWVWLGSNFAGWIDGVWTWEFDTSNLPSQDGAAFYMYAYDWAYNYVGDGVYNLSLGGDSGTDTVGLFDPDIGKFYLTNNHGGGRGDWDYKYYKGSAPTNRIPISGDWDGNGVETAGLFDQDAGRFYLTNSHGGGAGSWDYKFFKGSAPTNRIPIVGDWDGDGIDTVGLYDPDAGRVYLTNSHDGGKGSWDHKYFRGPTNSTRIPIVGDWNGDGIDTVGLFDQQEGRFYLSDSHVTGRGNWDYKFFKGGAPTSRLPVAGDWDGDGIDTVGLFDLDSGRYFLTNSHGGGKGSWDYKYFRGPANSNRLPVTGDWDGQ